MKLAIIAAMDAELDAFVRAFPPEKSQEWAGRPLHFAKSGNLSLILGKSGVGKVNAAMFTQYLIGEQHCDALIFTGLAGAINPNYQIGDIIAAEDCIQHDMDATALGAKRGEFLYSDLRIFKSDPRLLGMTTGQAHQGRVLTGDQFIAADMLNRMPHLRELEGDAVEMEGAAMAQVCTLHRRPFLLLRCISDRADATAHIDFPSFLSQAAESALSLVRHILPQIESRSTEFEGQNLPTSAKIPPNPPFFTTG